MARIRARDLVVQFPIYAASTRSIKNAVLRATTGGKVARESGRRVTVTALDQVSFDFRAGDRVGILGHNGSGKTTLLRVLAGAYEPVAGELSIDGRVASLLDLSLGLDPEATGYENILVRGLMMGYSVRQMRSRTDEIAAFSELGDYLNMPVRTYSSGMQLRLAFSVATSVEADVLIMDEWLSAGDAGFAEKAAARLLGLVERSSILVLATHSPDLVQSLCNRVLRLEHGRVLAEESRRVGEPEPAQPASITPLSDTLAIR
jgi:lipopolysaccharide transport system ATP-binding protein